MIIPNQKNIKVHFAGAEDLHMYYACEFMGVKYSLYTAFRFLERSVLKTKKSPLMPAHLKGCEHEIPKYISERSVRFVKHHFQKWAARQKPFRQVLFVYAMAV